MAINSEVAMGNEDEMARAVAQGLHQYEHERREEARRRYLKQAWLGIGAGVIFLLAVLASFGKLG
ncbi:hypothetical protein ACH4RA_06335 [Streptomyces smyrnaeus]|uniref:hypothetical protein n=1 Tax=Streptomyces smyrnaeus TaxID=1387713 RepID=UPI0037937359